MNKYRNYLIALSAVLLFLFWVFRPHQSPEIDKVDPTLKALTQPYKKVETFYFQDGGSVGVEIVGANDKAFRACFQAFSLVSENNQYQRLFIGAIHHTYTQAKETKNENTKLRVLEILRQRSGNKLYDDACIAKSSTRWSDYFTIIWKRYVLNKKNYLR